MKPILQRRVAAVIETLAEAGSAELRANCYLQAVEGLDTCADRVAITFSDIEVACKEHGILQAGGGHDQMADLLRGLFRMDALNNFVRNDIAGRQEGVDEIVVFIAYRVKLRNKLQLPCETEERLYRSPVNNEDLDRAKDHVLAAERADNGANLVEFAIEQRFWKEYLESNPSYKQAKDEIDGPLRSRLDNLNNRPIEMPEIGTMNESDQIKAQREEQLSTICLRLNF